MKRKCILAAAIAGLALSAGQRAAWAQALRVDFNSDNLMETPNPDAGFSPTQGLDGSNVPNNNPNPPFDPWFLNGGRDSSGGDPRLQFPVFSDDTLTSPFTPHYPGTRIQLSAASGDVMDSGRRFGLVAAGPPNYAYNDMYRDYFFNTNTSAPYDPNDAMAGEHTAATQQAPNGPLNINVSGLTAGTYAVTFFAYDKWMDLDTSNPGQSTGVSRFDFTDASGGSTNGNVGMSAIYGRNNAPGGALTDYTWSVTMLINTSNGTMSINQRALQDFGGSGNTLTSAVINGIEVNAINTVWQGGGANTNFSTAGNWTNGAPTTGQSGFPLANIPQGQFNKQIAYFPQAASAQTVTMDTTATFSQLVIDSTNSYTFNGSSSIQLSGGGLAVMRGNHTISAPIGVAGQILNLTVPSASSSLNITGDVTLNDATLTVPNAKLVRGVIHKQGAGKVTMKNINASIIALNGGTLAVATNGTNTGLSNIGTIVIGANTALDLNDNDMIVGKLALDGTTYQGTSVGSLQSAIAAARHGGAWDASGITSSAAKNSVIKNKTLGLLTGAEFHSTGGTTFDGQPVNDAQSIIKYTYYGDTDLNGIVNFDDYSRTDAGFNNNRSGWLNGDFDYNSIVNFDDYSLIDNAFNTQSGSLRRAMNYLEGGDRNRDTMNTPALQLVMQHFDEFGVPYAQGFLNAVPEPTSAVALAGVMALTTMSRRVRRRTQA